MTQSSTGRSLLTGIFENNGDFGNPYTTLVLLMEIVSSIGRFNQKENVFLIEQTNCSLSDRIVLYPHPILSIPML